jgi:protein-S-isoprenylcysteine O-methyltransferase Ste14
MDRRGWVITILALVLPGYLCIRFRPPTMGPIEIAGLALTITGLGLVALARIQLGRAFSIRPHARTLVTSGLYSKIRNPIYVFSAVALAGLALYFGKPLFLLGFLVLVPVQLLRARAEARVLEQTFGESYLRYKNSTWF